MGGTKYLVDFLDGGTMKILWRTIVQDNFVASFQSLSELDFEDVDK